MVRVLLRFVGGDPSDAALVVKKGCTVAELVAKIPARFGGGSRVVQSLSVNELFTLDFEEGDLVEDALAPSDILFVEWDSAPEEDVIAKLEEEDHARQGSLAQVDPALGDAGGGAAAAAAAATRDEQDPPPGGDEVTFSITTAQQRTISVHLPPTASFADLEDAVAAELNICPTPGARVDVEEDADTVAAAEQSGGGGGGGGSGPIKLRIKFLTGRTIDLPRGASGEEWAVSDTVADVKAVVATRERCEAQRIRLIHNMRELRNEQKLRGFVEWTASGGPVGSVATGTVSIHAVMKLGDIAPPATTGSASDPNCFYLRLFRKVGSHPLVTTTKTRLQTLTEWGFAASEGASEPAPPENQLWACIEGGRLGTVPRELDASDGFMHQFSDMVSWAPLSIREVESDESPLATVQSPRGKATFLASLYAIVQRAKIGRGGEHNAGCSEDELVLAIQRATAFPPATRAISLLCHGNIILGAERAALASSLFEWFRHIIDPSQERDDDGEDDEGADDAHRRMTMIFEQSRFGFALLLDSNEESADAATASTLTNLVEYVSLTCDLSGSRLRDPVRMGGPQQRRCVDGRRYMTRSEYDALSPEMEFGKLLGASSYDDFELALYSRLEITRLLEAALRTGDGTITDKRFIGYTLDAITEDTRARRLLLDTSADTNDEVAFLSLEAVVSIAATTQRIAAPGRRRCMEIIKSLKNHPTLRICAATKLHSARPPAMTLSGTTGQIVVFSSRPGCSENIMIFDPLKGEEAALNPDLLAQQISRLPEAMRADFATELILDERDTQEVILLLVDKSESMGAKGFSKEEGSVEEIFAEDEADGYTEIEMHSDDDWSAEAAHQTDAEGGEGVSGGASSSRSEDKVLRRRKEVEHFLSLLEDSGSELHELRRIVALATQKRVLEKVQGELRSFMPTFLLQRDPKAPASSHVSRRRRYKRRVTGIIRACFSEFMAIIERATPGAGDLEAAACELSVSERMMESAPSSLRCGITMMLFMDPVVCEDGHTYERDAIEKWLDRTCMSPMTRQILERSSEGKWSLVPSYSMRQMVDAWVRTQDVSRSAAEEDDRDVDEDDESASASASASAPAANSGDALSVDDEEGKISLLFHMLSGRMVPIRAHPDDTLRSLFDQVVAKHQRNGRTGLKRKDLRLELAGKQLVDIADDVPAEEEGSGGEVPIDVATAVPSAELIERTRAIIGDEGYWIRVAVPFGAQRGRTDDVHHTYSLRIMQVDEEGGAADEHQRSDVRLPPGASIDRVLIEIKRVVAELCGIPSIQQQFEIHKLRRTVRLYPDAIRTKSIEKFHTELRKISVTSPIQVIVNVRAGERIEAMRQHRRDSQRTLRDLNFRDQSNVHVHLRWSQRMQQRGTTMLLQFEEKRGFASHASWETTMAVDSEDAASLVILRLWRMRLSQDPQSHFSPETATLWCGLKSIGDGYLCGHHMQPQRNVGRYRSHIMPSYSPSEGTSVVNTKIGIMLGSSLGQDDAKLSRMETLKQLFHAFVNRASAYDFPCQLGLVSFGSSVEQLGEISSVFTDFLEHSDSLEPKGDTKLFDAIHFGVQKLVEFRDAQIAAGKPAPERLRLICISDGDDNGSDISPLEAAIALQNSGVVLDSICIGGAQLQKLHATSKASGGYVFRPQNLHDALKLCELETMLSSGERPSMPRGRGPILTREGRWGASQHRISDLAQYANIHRFPLDECSDNVVPPRRANPSLDGISAPLADTVADLEGSVGGGGGSATSGGVADGGGSSSAAVESSPSAFRFSAAVSGASGKGKPAASAAVLRGSKAGRKVLKRVLKEMKKLLPSREERECGETCAHPMFEIFVNETNCCFWRLLVRGPEDSPYRGGIWLISIEFGTEYPLEAPSVRFITPIRHCNINSHGRVCHSILDRNWSSTTSVRTILDCVSGLLTFPELSDPLDSNLAQQHYAGDGIYETRIQEHTAQHAKNRTMAEWKEKLTDGYVPSSAPASSPLQSPLSRGGSSAPFTFGASSPGLFTFGETPEPPPVPSPDAFVFRAPSDET